ncbi:MAG: preprotein translocase subunit SecA [Nitrospinae bacterium]|nr:preprotein translocase subunit SecA [Nitrospinota bacterium]
MIGSIFKKVFGSKNERELKRIQVYVEAVNALEPEMKALSDEELRDKTGTLKKRIAEGFSEISKSLSDEEKKREEYKVLYKVLPEAFALVREASVRVLNMRHFDVQIIGGVVLFEGKIAEMKTGEGKTLVSTLPIFLYGLTGRGVHLVTVNDYLAKRDAGWMGEIYQFLGLTVGTIQHDMRDEERKKAYQSDITYGTNNEFGFDFLRDNMKFSLNDYVQREHYFAVVDEVDSILVDEARTPLIISGPTEDSTDKYYKIDKIIPKLVKSSLTIDEQEKSDEEPDGDYQIDEKGKSANLTEGGVAKVEGLLNIDNLYDPANVETLHHVQQALKAHSMYKCDVDYIVKDGQVLIVDEFTGRLMPGRRWSDGLHQAVEAKEGVKIENENQTLATITLQNYFRLYHVLSGMTGTADTEAAEFQSIYNLEVIVIPTNQPMIRKDFADSIYRTEREKFNAITDEIEELHKKGQPVLVGTISINNSEKLNSLLKKRGVPHNVLNAKFHEKEAEIVAQAGRLAAVTIATNMAGRGTDIVLGGNPDFLTKHHLANEPDLTDEAKKGVHASYANRCREERAKVLELGGLHILGTERHESRRIDNQLRGRSGRQGDPGSSRFYLSLEDDLLRIFGSDRISGIMQRLGMEEGEPIEHGLVSKAIENAQKRVEGHNFDIRKHLLEYDDVMSRQREVIYDMRKELLIAGKDSRDILINMAEDVISNHFPLYIEPKVHFEDWDITGLVGFLKGEFGLNAHSENGHLTIEGVEPILAEEVRSEKLHEDLVDAVAKAYDKKADEAGNPEVVRHVEKMLILQIIDSQWKDHLLSMDHLREGIGFRGYGQKDPLNEYKREGFELFAQMIERINQESCRNLFRIHLSSEEEGLSIRRKEQKMVEHRGDIATSGGETAATVKRDNPKVGRNDPCPCGSGHKYKKCCGA